jgi:RNA polymerase sigma factor (sigma-70 family)
MPVGAKHPVAETDPVRAALSDSTVQVRLQAAARVFLSSRAFNLSPARRSVEAEEIVQKAKLRALEHQADYDSSREIVPWLVGFVLNVTREYVKQHKRRVLDPPLPIELENLIVDLGRPVDDAIADKEFVAQLLKQLSAVECDIVRMVYEEQLTFAEIADRTDLTENAARQRHHRIIESLRILCESREARS